MLTIVCILAVCALIGTILSLMGKAPLGIPVLLLCIVETLRCLPLQ